MGLAMAVNSPSSLSASKAELAGRTYRNANQSITLTGIAINLR